MSISLKTKEDEIKTALFDLVVAFLLATVSVVLRGVVLSYLWEWFIVPFGIQSIGIAHALGVSTIVMFLTFHGLHVKKELHPAKTRLVLSTLFPIIVFGVGYLYHLYV